MVSIDSSRFGTQSPIFLIHLKGLSFALNLKNWFQRLVPKKCGVFLDVESAASRDTPHVVTATVAALGYRHMGCGATS